MIFLRALAPVPSSKAFFAISLIALSENIRWILSLLNSLSYSLVIAFFGKVRIFSKSSKVSGSSLVITGRRPRISGIMPNFWSFLVSIKFWSFCVVFSNPTTLFFTLSSPSKLPAQINRTFDVSNFKYSWYGCLRPPWGGTLTIFPSMIFSNEFWTPSPIHLLLLMDFPLFLRVYQIHQ